MEVIVDKRREANTQLFSSSTAHLVQKLQLVQKNFLERRSLSVLTEGYMAVTKK